MYEILSRSIYGMYQGRTAAQRLSPSSTHAAVRLPVGAPDVFMKRMIAGQRPTMSEKWPQAVRDLMSAMWEADASKRPSAKEVRQTLEALKDELTSMGPHSSSKGSTAGQGACACVVM
eukprot:scaffold1108_cov387-Prasinococcus_capsulatus_cf.AAC.14